MLDEIMITPGQTKHMFFIGFSDMSKESYFGIKIYLQWVPKVMSVQTVLGPCLQGYDMAAGPYFCLAGAYMATLGPTTWPYWGQHCHNVASMDVLGSTRSYWGLQGLNGA